VLFALVWFVQLVTGGCSYAIAEHPAIKAATQRQCINCPE
jgi:hypothetical protein